MATALLHDVASYSTTRGSAVYSCSLDAEGAFDAIPHCILFDKASPVLPNPCWYIMYNWYNNLSVKIKWKSDFSAPIQVSIGTRQGGLSSPLLFNIFYQNLVELVSDMPCGIRIGSDTYNVFCYADDLILTSHTPTGLQTLIDTALKYITSHGLNFNPIKTVCTTFGNCHLATSPIWKLRGEILREEKDVTYLGSTLSNDTVNHKNSRMASTRRAFYGLQGAGLCDRGVNPRTIAHIFSTALQPILTFGDAAVGLRPKDVKELEKTQASLIKVALGLPKTCKNSPLLDALHIKRVDELLHAQTLSLLRRSVLDTSQARRFYLHLLRMHQQFNMSKHTSLLANSKVIADDIGISLMQYIFDDSYANAQKNRITHTDPNGLTDSLRFLLNNYSDPQAQVLTSLLLKPF